MDADVEEETYQQDSWPKMPDGTSFDGTDLLDLVRSGNSPFQADWDVNLLIREVEEILGSQVTDIPSVSKGSNNYGFHMKMSNQPDLLARIARGDVNMPDFDGFPLHVQIMEVKFEAAVYNLLLSEPTILASRLLYYRPPLQHDGPRTTRPKDILGRRLLVFRCAEGENNLWGELSSEQQASLLAQAARIRASLFNYQLPLDFARTWLRERIFEQRPNSIPVPIAPSRDFWVATFLAKIEATIKNVGDMIGWESDNNVVGPNAAAAKQSLLQLIPHILPADESLYRLVLEHGDFGIHNMSILWDERSDPRITSLYDWETGCIVPIILSDPEMAVYVDLITDEDARPAVKRVSKKATASDHMQHAKWAEQYIEALYEEAPDYERAIRAGKDARHLWFALRGWRGDDPEDFFGDLGKWAESRMKELGVV